MFIFYEFRPFCIDNARFIYRKIRYLKFESDLLVCNFCFYISVVIRIQSNTFLSKARSRNLGCLRKSSHYHCGNKGRHTWWRWWYCIWRWWCCIWRWCFFKVGKATGLKPTAICGQNAIRRK